MLPQYSAVIFFPGGDPAAGATITVSLDGSNVVPLLFADSAATTPIGPGIVADLSGAISFYAAPGLYLAQLAGTYSRVGPDPGWGAPVVPDVFIHTQTMPAAVWTIDHYFDTKPAVSIDTGTAHVETQVDHPTLTQTVLTFSSAVTGAAYLRR